MNSTFRCFLAPKQGEDPEDCEDSVHPEPGASPEGAGRVFAVSDGTTTSFFSGLWARILTRHFAANPAAAFDLVWGDWLKDAQREWLTEVRQRAEAPEASFYTRNDVSGRRPGAATFLGLLLEPPNPDGGIPWRALVLGDSCLFLLGKDGTRSIALTRAEEFSNSVKAAESYETGHLHQPVQFASAPRGTEPALLDGDVILLATDALSKWLLVRAEFGQPVWGSVLSLGSPSEFETFIADARREAQSPLDNDDVALVVLKMGAPHQRHLQCRFDPKPKPQQSPPPAVRPGDISPASKVATEKPLSMPQSLTSAVISAASWATQHVRLIALSLAGLLVIVSALGWDARRTRRNGDTIAALNHEVAVRTDEIARLQEALNRSQRQGNTLHQEVEATKKATERLRTGLDQAEARNTALTGSITTQEEVVASLRTNLNHIQVQYKIVAGKLAESERQKTGLVDQLKRGAETEKQKLDDAKFKIARLQADNDDMRKAILGLEQEIKDLKNAPPGVKPPTDPAPQTRNNGAARPQTRSGRRGFC